MSSTIFFFFFIPLLSLILLTINIIFAPHNPYTEKNSAFECGFTSFLGQNRIQFSISFFIFALLFLLFDLEILLVYPYLVSAYINETYGLLTLMIFLGVLTIGFIFELGKKALTIDSRQTALSSFNLTKISLSNTTFSKLNLISVKSFYKGSVFNENLENLHVKIVNFHSYSFYVKKESNICVNRDSSNEPNLNKLIVVNSSLFNFEYLFTKTFFNTYLNNLKNKFNYKWFICISLAILFTYFFRNMLRYNIGSLGLDLDSINGIAVLISLTSIFFKAIFHLFELIIYYETDKIYMGPNNVNDIKISKNLTDVNAIWKKNGIDTINENNTKDGSNSSNIQNEASSGNMQNQVITNDKFDFNRLPKEIQIAIADEITLNEKQFNSEIESLLKYYDELKRTVILSQELDQIRYPEELRIMSPNRFSAIMYRDSSGIEYIHHLPRVPYDRSIIRIKNLIGSQIIREVLLPESPLLAKGRTDEPVNYIKEFEKATKNACWNDYSKDKVVKRLPDIHPNFRDKKIN